MIVYICGPHGVGKTTLVKSVNLDAIKVFDIDINDALSGGISARNQFIRHELFFNKVGEALKGSKNVIVDQCPEAVSFYDKAHHKNGFISDDELLLLEADYNKRLGDFKELVKRREEVYVYLRAGGDLLVSNIKSRSRDKSLNEGDVDYLSMIVDYYESMIRDKSVVIELKKADDYGLALRKVMELFK